MLASHTQISNKITSSLSLGKQVASASHSSLLSSHVDFTPSDNDHSMSTNALKAKYRQFGTDNDNNKMLPEVHMNGQTKFTTSHKSKNSHNGFEDNNRNYVADGIPQPKVQLYNPAKISLEWKQTHKIGAGLVNVGNTCFMNTVLQCLTYCPPLANYLLFEEDHCAKCKLGNFCLMCEMQKHMKRVMDHHGQAIKPLSIYQKLRSIAKHFQFGRQEDAHEFLRYVIDHLWKASLANSHTDFKLDPASKETTVINYIFGGYNRSQVICLNCQGRSNTFDHFMDFILDIKNVSSLEGALKKFVEPEMLEDDNAYKCPKCGTKVRAEKKFTVHRAPNVATFQFKRFDYNRMFGGKITKHVTYPERLDLRPYMSENKGSPVTYKLSSVLVHMGHTCNSGHYYCYIRNSNGLWYVMDDTRVSQVTQNQVLAQQAYVLFYVKVQPTVISKGLIKKPISSLPSNSKLVKNGPIGPNLDSRVTLPQSPYINHHHSCVSNSSTSLSTSNPNSIIPNGKHVFNPNGNSPRPNNSFSNNHHLKRDKISFDIKRPLVTSSTTNSSKTTNGNIATATGNNLNNTYRPDLGGVVIVKGNEMVNNKLKIVPKTLSVLNATATTTATKTLVPYAGDSSETDDEKPLPSNKMVNGHCNNIKKDSTAALKLSEIPLPGEKDLLKKVTTTTNVSEKNPAVLPQDSSSVFDQPSSRLEKSLAKLSLPLNSRTSEGLRVKSTLNWNVLEDRNLSPSITSNSSNCSINSTTDWNVTEQENLSAKKERGIHGNWSIKSKETANHLISSAHSKDKKPLDVLSISSREIASGDGGVNTSSSAISGGVNRLANDSGHRENGVVSSEVDRLGLPPNSFPGRGEPDRCERQFTNRDPHGGDNRTSPGCNSGKSNSNNTGGGGDATQSKSQNNDSRVVNRKRWRHDFDSGNEKGDISLSKKYKAIGGESNREPAQEKQCNGRIATTTISLNQSCDNNVERRKKKKKSHRKRSDDESSESSYEWIEKTKETVEAEKTKPTSVAPSKLWDADIRDGYKRNQDNSYNKATTNGGTHWDGTRKGNVVSELLELSGKGDSSNVTTWDGSQSMLDRDNSRDGYRKRFYPVDDYDEEFDKGKVKKIKKRYSEPDFNKSSRNPFQQYHQQNRRDRPNDRFSWNRNSQSNNGGGGAKYNNNNNGGTYPNNRYSFNNKGNNGGGGDNRYRYHSNGYQNHNRSHNRYHNPNYSR